MTKVRKHANDQDEELDAAPQAETAPAAKAEPASGLVTLHRDEETVQVAETNWKTNRHIWENAGWRLPAQE